MAEVEYVDPFADVADDYVDPFADTQPEYTAPPLDLTANPLDGMPEQERAAIEPMLTDDDLQMVNATNYYDNKFGTNHTPEMVSAQIEYEYGENATPATANQKNNLFKDTMEYTGRLTAGGAAQMPTLRAEVGQLRNKWVDDIAGKFGLSDMEATGLKALTIPKNPALFGAELANKAWGLIPSEKLQEWGADQVGKASAIQSEHMSGVPLEDSVKSGDWETAGKDVATAIAFESPRMAIQIALGMISPEASLEMMFATSAGAKRADKTADDSLEERTLAPIAVGATEVLTEKFLGTQRIIDKAMSGKFVSGMAGRFKQILTDMSGGALSETGATFGENVVDKLSGEEVELTRGLLMSGVVGSIMDVGAGQMMTLGDANRIRKQNTDAEVQGMVEKGDITQKEADVVLAPETEREQALNAMYAEEQKFAEEAMATKQKIDGEVTTPEGKPTQVVKEEVAPEVVGDEETRITVEADNLLREEYGKDPTKDPETREHSVLIQESINSDRDINVLLDELQSQPRPTTDFEAADIAREKARLSKSLKSNKKNLKEARESDNDADIEKFAVEKKLLGERLIDFTDIARLAKTETGRALSAYNLTLNKKKDLTDHINDATAEKGGKLSPNEYGGIEAAHDEAQAVEDKIDEISGEPKDISEKIQELRDNIDQKKRTVEETKEPKKKSEQQKQLELLREIQSDQDTMFELIKQLDEQTAKLANPKIKNDPEGYKSTIEILLELRSKSKWWKDLQNSKLKSDKRRVKLLNDVLDNLQAQYDGKFRNIKEDKTDVTTDEIVDLKNKIAYIREAMRLEDKIASIDEDTRLVVEGRLNEVTPTKSLKRASNRDKKLDSLHNELAAKRRRLETLKSDIGTSKTIKALEFQRAMKLSLDSWLLRQGGPSLKSNPFLTLDAWFKSFAGYSESKFYETQRMVESTQSFKDSKDKMGVVYNDIDAGFEQHQEAINSSLAEKIPPVRGSNRHMVLGVNLLRWNLSKKALNKYPNESAEFYQAYGKFINDLTGRGGLGNLEKSARGLTAFFTAPRYTTSKWSNIANMRRAWVVKDGKKEFNQKLAKEIAGQKARMFSGYAGMATALIAMGFEMGMDPEDPLFMKFRKGKVVIDIAPHMTAELRLASLYMEAFAANALGIGELEGNYDADMFNKTLRYAGYKVVPTIGTILEAAEGKTVVGEERTIAETLALYPLPIMIEGLYQDLIKDQEDLSDIITSQSAQFIGAGGGIYDDTEQSFDRLGD